MNRPKCSKNLGHSGTTYVWRNRTKSSTMARSWLPVVDRILVLEDRMAAVADCSCATVTWAE